MERKLPWLVNSYKGNNESKTYTSENHGFYIINLDDINPLTFTIKGMTFTLDPTKPDKRQSLLSFKEPFHSVEITNPSECEFMCGGIE